MIFLHFIFQCFFVQFSKIHNIQIVQQNINAEYISIGPDAPIRIENREKLHWYSPFSCRPVKPVQMIFALVRF